MSIPSCLQIFRMSIVAFIVNHTPKKSPLPIHGQRVKVMLVDFILQLKGRPCLFQYGPMGEVKQGWTWGLSCKNVVKRLD